MHWPFLDMSMPKVTIVHYLMMRDIGGRARKIQRVRESESQRVRELESQRVRQIQLVVVRCLDNVRRMRDNRVRER